MRTAIIFCLAVVFGPVSGQYISVYRENGLEGYVKHVNGKYDTIVKAKYGHAAPFYDGMARVSPGKRRDTSSRYGYISPNGSIAIPMIYFDAWDFHEGLALVAKGPNFASRRYGYIDRSGKEVIPFLYEEARKMNGGIAAVKDKGKWKLIDKTGKTLLPLNYDFVGTFYEDMARVQKGDRWGYINKTGQLVIPLSHKYATSFHQGKARIEPQNNNPTKEYLIDKTGKIVVERDRFRALKEEKGKSDDDVWGMILGGEQHDILITARQDDEHEYAPFWSKIGFGSSLQAATALFSKPGELTYKSGKEAFDRKDYPEALKLLESSAKVGYDPAMALLGYMYGTGAGVNLDYKLAREWSEKAAAKGNADAMFVLAVIYAQGSGVAADETIAMNWLQKAAKAGNPQAIAQISLLQAQEEYNQARIAYDKQDFAQALKLFESAAQKGYPDAMFGLGLMHFNGNGVEVNQQKGVEWLQKAADGGSEQAQQALKSLK